MTTKQLLVSLPSSFDGEPESQARAALALVVTLALGIGEEAPIPEDPSTCPNCGQICEAKRTPYCSEQCREMAGFVRQFRTGLVEEWLALSDKQVALGQVFWHVLGGGRPLRLSMISPKERERVFKREGGLCQVCGAMATTVDHSGSACNRTSNLRAVCETCGTDRAFGSPLILDDPVVQERLADIALRIGSPRAIRCCDDAVTWDWRKYLQRRAIR